MNQNGTAKPFLPIPNQFKIPIDNEMSAKPVGPHMTAPHFGYNRPAHHKSFDASENPFEETQISSISEAQNSPYFNLQK